MWFLLSLVLGLVGCDRPSGYVRKGGGWRYGDVAVTPVDMASFQPLNDSFARDAQRGYYRDSAIADSDGASFEALGEHEAKDRRAVYYADTYRKGQEYWSILHLRVSLVRDADPASYRLLAHGYARDQQRAFFEGAAFAVHDLASFVPLSPQFARDQQRGYYERIEIPGSDGASFALVDPNETHYVRDRKQVYHAHIATDDPEHRNRPVVRTLASADPQSFRVMARGYAVDAKQVWYQGTRLTREVTSFELLPRSYARTATRVFHDGQVVRGADAASFVELEPPSDTADARDRSGSYLQGERVEVTVGTAAPAVKPGSRAR